MKVKKFSLVFAFVLCVTTTWSQYKLYQEGLEKYNEKDYYGAIELFSDFLTKPLHDKKFNADAHYWRGLAAFKLNDFISASEDLKQSLALKHPNTGNIHWFLGKSFYQLNQLNDAVVEYGNALRILASDKSKEAQILTERAQVYVKLDNFSAAQQDLQIAAAIDPTNKKIKEDLNNLVLAKSRSTGAPSTELAKATDQKNTEKKEEKKTPAVEQKVDLPAGQAGIKKEAVAQNEPAKTNPPAQSATVPPPVVTVSVQAAPAEPTLADLYKDEKRHALIIGNSAYPKQIGVLKNPVNDATDFAEAIKKLGFDVTLITDASYGKTRAEMMKFRDKLNEGERDKTVGLFYYAGHGLQHDNENYIVPVDAELAFEDDINRYCFPIQKMVLTQMENSNSRMNIVILDACRNNPFPAIHRGIGESQGLGELKKAKGAFIAYATSPGSVASDGTGRNGLYTQELIKAMNKPGRTIEQVFKDVRASVLRQSGDKQNPWENSNITGDFYFKFDQ